MKMEGKKTESGVEGSSVSSERTAQNLDSRDDHGGNHEGCHSSCQYRPCSPSRSSVSFLTPPSRFQFRISPCQKWLQVFKRIRRDLRFVVGLHLLFITHVGFISGGSSSEREKWHSHLCLVEVGGKECQAQRIGSNWKGFVRITLLCG